MKISDAQREVRTVYLGGFPGAIVAGTLWLLAALVATFDSPRRGMWLLVIGGMFIFPLTQLMLRVMGRPASLSPENPLRFLAMQIAFTVPFSIPLAGAAALYRIDWFFPAMMLIVGAHYLPFTFLYGMRSFLPLAGVLIFGAVGIGTFTQGQITLAAWATSACLFAFAPLGLHAVSGGAIAARSVTAR